MSDTPTARTKSSRAFTVVVAALAVASTSAAVPFAIHDAPSPPNALWTLVASCIDRPSGAEPEPYCRCPAMIRSCCHDVTTPDDDVVWAVTPQLVALRDMTSCGCAIPSGAVSGAPPFVAGLAMPRTHVTGIEDPSRPDAIWPFAWQVAKTRIPDELEIGLVINPVDTRTQDQMHVHLLRLTAGVRARLDALRPTADGAQLAADAIVVPLPDLDRVFRVAQDRVGAAAMGAHGILVARARGDGYLAVLTTRSSPQAFTVNACGG